MSKRVVFIGESHKRRFETAELIKDYVGKVEGMYVEGSAPGFPGPTDWRGDWIGERNIGVTNWFCENLNLNPSRFDSVIGRQIASYMMEYMSDGNSIVTEVDIAEMYANIPDTEEKLDYTSAFEFCKDFVTKNNFEYGVEIPNEIIEEAAVGIYTLGLACINDVIEFAKANRMWERQVVNVLKPHNSVLVLLGAAHINIGIDLAKQRGVEIEIQKFLDGDEQIIDVKASQLLFNALT